MKPDGRIRVMEIIDRMNIGGPATQVSGLAKELDAEEFDRRLYTGYVDGHEGDHLQPHDSGTPVHRVPGLGRSVRPGDGYRALFWLIRAMRTFRPHVVHTHTAKAGALGRMASRLSGVGSARVHVFHGHLLHSHLSPFRRGLHVRSERILATVSDRLVTVGSRIRDDLLQAGIGRPAQYVVIPPGLRPGPVPDRRAARAALGLPPDAPVVAYVGHLTRVKRPDRFLAMADAVSRQIPGCRFVMCGGGELERQVARDVEPVRDSFQLLGWRKDVGTVYAAADVVVLTSDNEGTPLVLIEAGMAGKPVVSTRVGSVAEVVRDGHTGLLSSTDPAELAAHIVRLLRDPGLARRMGESARDWTEYAFNVERLVTDTEHLYRSLCGRADRRLTAEENAR